MDWEFSQALLDKAFSGNEWAREELWRRFRACAWTLAAILGAKKNLRDEGDLEDVVQNVMVELLRMDSADLAAVADWPGWIYTILERRMIDSIRRRARRRGRESSLDEIIGEDSTLYGMLPDPKDIRERIELQELKERIEAFLGTLSKERPDVFRLYMQGYSQKEIAQMTGLSVAAVNMHIFRTKCALREAFACEVRQGDWQRK